jgi:hypothetical protein
MIGDTPLAATAQVPVRAPSQRPWVVPLALPGAVDNKRLSWAAAASVPTAAGLLIVAFAYNAARADQLWARGLFWVGLIVVLTPAAVALVHPAPRRLERIGLVAVLGLATYCLKVLYSPIRFNLTDEMQHLRTVNDILQTGHLFSFNPILQVSALYPGLEIVTHALVSATSLSVFWAGIIVVGAARLLLVVGLFLVYERIGRSAPLAGAAVLFYIANPQYLYLDGQFGYEALALGMLGLVLYATVRRGAVSRDLNAGLVAVAVLGIGAIVITHHFTQFVLAALLAAWAAVTLALALAQRRADPGAARRGLRESATVGALAVFCLAAGLLWLVEIASPVVDYLGPNFVIGFIEFFRLLSGQGAARVPFQDGARQAAPLFEQVVGYASILLAVGALPFGLRELWRRFRFDGLALVLGIVGALYPLTLPLRLTPAGIATSGRLPEFLYLGLGFVLALAVMYARPFQIASREWQAGPVAVSMRAMRIPSRIWRAGLAAFAVVLLAGGPFVGWGPPGRLPGAYQVSSDARSIQPEGLAAAEWAREYLGPNRFVATDRYDALMFGSYGQQHILSVTNGRIDASTLFFAPTMDPVVRFLIRASGMEFVVIDRRLSQGLPVSGMYYENQEPGAFQHTVPVDPAALDKFDNAPDVSRVFDSGNLSIYDTGLISHAP